MKAKTYQAARDAFEKFINHQPKTMSSDEIFEGKFICYDYNDIVQIYKPVAMPAEKIMGWFAEFGYESKVYGGKYFFIEFKGEKI